MSDLSGSISPLVFKSGDKITIRVDNLPSGASNVQAQLDFRSDIETSFWMQVPLRHTSFGFWEATTAAAELVREAAVYVSAVSISEERHQFRGIHYSICNPAAPVAQTEDAVRQRFEAISRRRKDRYQKALGDSKDQAKSEFRVAFIVEDLLITTPLSLPGIRIFGLDARPQGLDAAALATEVAGLLGWNSEVKQPDWSSNYANHHPVAVIVCDQVFAEDAREAFRIGGVARDEAMAILALMRGAAGSPGVGIAQELKHGRGISTAFSFGRGGYTGNLIGGPFSGESQESLLIKHLALRHDALLKLCVDLFEEALAEPSVDSKYFRLWSVLETLAINRIPDGKPVTLLDGSPWAQNPKHATTSSAAPRVYELIANTIFRGPVPIDEQSLTSPASNLHDAVTKVYARRNATSHYGKFVASDPTQQNQHWYRRALATTASSGEMDEWMRMFERIAEFVLKAEMNAVGYPLI